MKWSASVFVDIPAPPTINEVVTLNDSAISILWLYEGDLEAILSYAIYIQREGAGEEFEKSIQIDRNIINSTISGLFPYTQYRVRIEAMDNNLHTASQVSGFIRTSESVPTAAPGNVASEEVNSTHLRIFWQVSVYPHQRVCPCECLPTPEGVSL